MAHYSVSRERPELAKAGLHTPGPWCNGGVRRGRGAGGRGQVKDTHTAARSGKHNKNLRAPFLVRDSCRTEGPTTSIPKQQAPETSHDQKVQKLNPNTKGEDAGKGEREAGAGRREEKPESWLSSA